MIAVIEMPKGTHYKYEQCKETGALLLDRVLRRTIPHNYGYLDGTLSPDGDALDVFVISSEPIPSLAKVRVAPFCVFKCTDNGVSDDKVIATIVDDPYADFLDVDFHLAEIFNYLNTYKERFRVDGRVYNTVALKTISEAQLAYETNKNPHWDSTMSVS